ncbi:high-affinity iron transporter [Fontibacillus panacisegetis]|uniref:High-affinity iron transporter n=1 Tax=Fontibacillus panacisegetis TaxID=670482 RepID=A0A1G7JSP6_9BACL|nr:FTR1 family protein [Fontibacillus panacisegetis]SDF27891.1 high-affinity iron transporter [Fontibacillus panacisegetis]
MFVSPAIKHNRRKEWYHFPISLLIGILLFTFVFSFRPLLVQAEEDPSLQSLLPLVGGALVEAGAQNWDKASSELEQFEVLWSKIDASASPDLSSTIQKQLASAKEAVGSQNSEEASASLSLLAKQVNQYVKDNGEKSDSPDGKEVARELLEQVKQTLTPLESGDVSTAQARYKDIINGWSKVESPIRNGNFGVYSNLETHMTMIRVALQTDPPKAEQAVKELSDLIVLLQNYIDGKLDDQKSAPGTNSDKTLADAVALLQQVKQSVEGQNGNQASELMQQFIVLWPSVEGEVSISSATLYTATENSITEAQSYLVSDPVDFIKAAQVIDGMISSLEPLTERTSYSAWDAAVILLREGLEAILVLAALLAFVNRTKDKTARNFIWAGAGTGLLLSAVIAVLLTFAVSQAVAGGTRETIEGFIGLAAVVMMLAVGHWLHNKSSGKAWSKYLAKQVGGALERGSLWSLFALSGLAILREGAETAVFYIGMAPSIENSQLIIGIASALAALSIIGFCIIRFSVKLPIRPFMLVASLLIYYLVIRFMGESIHALQIGGLLPAHSKAWLPTISWIGAYPTSETFISQLVLLVFVIWQLITAERNNKAAKAA